MIDAEKYPYDPALRLCEMGKAKGLDRLRWIPNRAQAQHMADMFEHLPRNESRAQRAELARIEERRQRLAKVAEAGKRGDHGEDAYDLAHQFFNLDPQRADLPRLEAYLKELQKLNIDVHNMPSRRGGGKRFRGGDE